MNPFLSTSRAEPRCPATHRKFRCLVRSVAIAAVAVLPVGVAAYTGAAEAAGVTCTNSVLVFTAHPDDSLLFESPDVLHDIQAGYCVRTVVASSGDASADSSYWLPRETGTRAAIANMAKVANAWTNADAGIPGHPMTLSTLRDRPTLSVVFMRLDDGNFDGTGFPAYGNVSMQQLWSGQITSMGTEDNSSFYTRASLIGTLSTLIAMSTPSVIRTQDYVGAFGDGDHSDHYALGRFTKAAYQQVSGNYTFIGYEGYNTADLKINVGGPDLTAKQNAFLAYARYDSGVCQTLKRCMAPGNQYGKWLQRQYTVGSETSTGTFPTLPVANAGISQKVSADSTVQLDGGASYSPGATTLQYSWTQVSGVPVALSDAHGVAPTFTAPSANGDVVFSLVVADSAGSSTPSIVTITSSNQPRNIALGTTAEASSENAATGQTASKAVDGCIDGWPGNYQCEWASNGTGSGTWLKLSWPAPVTTDSVTLWDRPNVDDQVTQAQLSFSDGGPVVAVGALPNDASSGLTVTFAPRTVTWVKLLITGVSPSTANAGLAEMQVFSAAQTTLTRLPVIQRPPKAPVKLFGRPPAPGTALP